MLRSIQLRAALALLLSSPVFIGCTAVKEVPPQITPLASTTVTTPASSATVSTAKTGYRLGRITNTESGTVTAQRFYYGPDNRISYTLFFDTKDSLNSVTKTTYAYTMAGQLQSRDSTIRSKENTALGYLVGSRFTYTYDAAGRLTEMRRYVQYASAPGGSGMDNLNNGIVYTYDAGGRLMRKTENGYRVNNRFGSSPASINEVTYTYSAGGQVSKISGVQTVDSGNGQFMKVSQMQSTFEYDANGQLTRQTDTTPAGNGSNIVTTTDYSYMVSNFAFNGKTNNLLTQKVAASTTIFPYVDVPPSKTTEIMTFEYELY